MAHHGLVLRMKDMLEAGNIPIFSDSKVSESSLNFNNHSEEAMIIKAWVTAHNESKNTKVEYISLLRKTLLFVLSGEIMKKEDLFCAIKYFNEKFMEITRDNRKIFSAFQDLLANPWTGFINWTELFDGSLNFNNTEVQRYFFNEPEDITLARINFLVNKRRFHDAMILSKQLFLYHTRVTKKGLFYSKTDFKVENGCSEGVYPRGHSAIDWFTLALLKLKLPLQQLIQELKNFSCHEGIEIICRTRLRNKIFSYTLLQIILMQELVNSSEYCCTKKLFLLFCLMHKELNSTGREISENSKKMLVPHARTSAHFYVFIDAVWEQFGRKCTDLYVEFYVRALCADLNHLENKKNLGMKNAVNDLTGHLATVFTKLSTLFQGTYLDVSRECLFSAFSLRPTEMVLNNLLDLTNCLISLDCGCGLSCGGTCDNVSIKEFSHPVLTKGIRSIPYHLTRDFVSVLENSRHINFHYNTFKWKESYNVLNNYLNNFYSEEKVHEVLHSNDNDQIQIKYNKNDADNSFIKLTNTKLPAPCSSTVKRKSLTMEEKDTVKNSNIVVKSANFNKKLKVQNSTTSSFNSVQRDASSKEFVNYDIMRQVLKKESLSDGIQKGQSAIYSISDKINSSNFSNQLFRSQPHLNSKSFIPQTVPIVQELSKSISNHTQSSSQFQTGSLNNQISQNVFVPSTTARNSVVMSTEDGKTSHHLLNLSANSSTENTWRNSLHLAYKNSANSSLVKQHHLHTSPFSSSQPHYKPVIKPPVPQQETKVSHDRSSVIQRTFNLAMDKMPNIPSEISLSLTSDLRKTMYLDHPKSLSKSIISAQSTSSKKSSLTLPSSQYTKTHTSSPTSHTSVLANPLTSSDSLCNVGVQKKSQLLFNSSTKMELTRKDHFKQNKPKEQYRHKYSSITYGSQLKSSTTTTNKDNLIQDMRHNKEAHYSNYKSSSFENKMSQPRESLISKIISTELQHSPYHPSQQKITYSKTARDMQQDIGRSSEYKPATEIERKNVQSLQQTSGNNDLPFSKLIKSEHQSWNKQSCSPNSSQGIQTTGCTQAPTTIIHRALTSEKDHSNHFVTKNKPKVVVHSTSAPRKMCCSPSETKPCESCSSTTAKCRLVPVKPQPKPEVMNLVKRVVQNSEVKLNCRFCSHIVPASLMQDHLKEAHQYCPTKTECSSSVLNSNTFTDGSANRLKLTGAKIETSISKTSVSNSEDEESILNACFDLINKNKDISKLVDEANSLEEMEHSLSLCSTPQSQSAGSNSFSGLVCSSPSTYGREVATIKRPHSVSFPITAEKTGKSYDDEKCFVNKKKIFNKHVNEKIPRETADLKRHSSASASNFVKMQVDKNITEIESCNQNANLNSSSRNSKNILTVGDNSLQNTSHVSNLSSQINNDEWENARLKAMQSIKYNLEGCSNQLHSESQHSDPIDKHKKMKLMKPCNYCGKVLSKNYLKTHINKYHKQTTPDSTSDFKKLPLHNTSELQEDIDTSACLTPSDATNSNQFKNTATSVENQTNTEPSLLSGGTKFQETNFLHSSSPSMQLSETNEQVHQSQSKFSFLSNYLNTRHLDETFEHMSESIISQASYEQQNQIISKHVDSKQNDFEISRRELVSNTRNLDTVIKTEPISPQKDSQVMCVKGHFNSKDGITKSLDNSTDELPKSSSSLKNTKKVTEKSFTCSLCYRKFAYKSNLYRHTEKAHCNEITSPPNVVPIPSFNCIQKPKDTLPFEKKEQFDCITQESPVKTEQNFFNDTPSTPQVIYKQFKTYVCQFCADEFSQKETLLQHVRNNHSLAENPIQLIRPSSAESLKSNNPVHSDSNLTFSPPNMNLLNPNQESSGEVKNRPNPSEKISCPACPKALVRPGSLNNHIKKCHPHLSLNKTLPPVLSPVQKQEETSTNTTVTNLSPGPTSNQTPFDQHTKLMSSPVKCSYCFKDFASKGNLTRHEKSVHNLLKEKFPSPNKADNLRNFIDPQRSDLHLMTTSNDIDPLDSQRIETPQVPTQDLEQMMDYKSRADDHPKQLDESLVSKQYYNPYQHADSSFMKVNKQIISNSIITDNSKCIEENNLDSRQINLDLKHSISSSSLTHEEIGSIENNMMKQEEDDHAIQDIVNSSATQSCLSSNSGHSSVSTSEQNCPLCKKTLACKWSLRRHLKKLHPEYFSNKEHVKNKAESSKQVNNKLTIFPMLMSNTAATQDTSLIIDSPDLNKELSSNSCIKNTSDIYNDLVLPIPTTVEAVLNHEVQPNVMGQNTSDLSVSNGELLKDFNSTFEETDFSILNNAIELLSDVDNKGIDGFDFQMESLEMKRSENSPFSCNVSSSLCPEEFDNYTSLEDHSVTDQGLYHLNEQVNLPTDNAVFSKKGYAFSDLKDNQCSQFSNTTISLEPLSSPLVELSSFPSKGVSDISLDNIMIENLSLSTNQPFNSSLDQNFLSTTPQIPELSSTLSGEEMVFQTTDLSKYHVSLLADNSLSEMNRNEIPGAETLYFTPNNHPNSTDLSVSDSNNLEFKNKCDFENSVSFEDSLIDRELSTHLPNIFPSTNNLDYLDSSDIKDSINDLPDILGELQSEESSILPLTLLSNDNQVVDSSQGLSSVIKMADSSVVTISTHKSEILQVENSKSVEISTRKNDCLEREIADILDSCLDDIGNYNRPVSKNPDIVNFPQKECEVLTDVCLSKPPIKINECRFCKTVYKSRKRLSNHLNNIHNVPVLKKQVSTSKTEIGFVNESHTSPPDLSLDLNYNNSVSTPIKSSALDDMPLSGKCSHNDISKTDVIVEISSTKNQSDKCQEVLIEPSVSSVIESGNDEEEVIKPNVSTRDVPLSQTNNHISNLETPMSPSFSTTCNINVGEAEVPCVDENLEKNSLPKCIIRVCKNGANSVFYEIDSGLDSGVVKAESTCSHLRNKAHSPFFKTKKYKRVGRKKKLVPKLKNLHQQLHRKGLKKPLTFSRLLHCGRKRGRKRKRPIHKTSIKTLKSTEILKFLKEFKQPVVCLTRLNTTSINVSSCQSLSNTIEMLKPVIKLERINVSRYSQNNTSEEQFDVNSNLVPHNRIHISESFDSVSHKMDFKRVDAVVCNDGIEKLKNSFHIKKCFVLLERLSTHTFPSNL